MPPESIIRSRQNPIYKQMRSLLRRDQRHQERAFLVEGPRFIADAMATGAVPTIVARSESNAAGMDWVEGADVTSRILDDVLFSTLVDTVTSQGIVAVFPIPELTSLPERIPFIVIADGVQDPGNLGTLIRSAAGAGATQVVALPGTVDPWAPKTVRAAAAAHFLIPVATMSLAALTELLPRPCLLLAADAAGTAHYDECDLTGPLAVIVGSEGSGLSSGALALSPHLVSIPLSPGVESLNAAVAGSIVFFEARRQRRAKANFPKTVDCG